MKLPSILANFNFATTVLPGNGERVAYQVQFAASHSLRVPAWRGCTEHAGILRLEMKVGLFKAASALAVVCGWMVVELVDPFDDREAFLVLIAVCGICIFYIFWFLYLSKSN